MGRMIDAYALIDDLDLLISSAIKDGSKVKYGHVRDLIMQQKQIDAQPVQHGRWVFQKGYNKECVDGWICTNCKYGFHTKVPYFEAFKYCPMCGARMDGGDDNGKTD